MGVVAIEDVLFPGIDVRVMAVHAAAQGVMVEATACGRPPDCPSCGCPGRRVHSRYRRRLAERPLAGRPLVITLWVRRFFCERSGCRRRTFVEQVPDLRRCPTW
jgi:transposase